MADVNATVAVGGEVRLVQERRDYVDRASGEVSPRKGRKAKVLTMGGFLDVSIPEKFDDVAFDEGSVRLMWVDVVPWTIQTERGPRSGTAFVYTRDVTEQDVKMLLAAPGPKSV
ncbi:MAG TPA: hypothetical protein VHZ81_05670 [Galbitalea sp.]|nr:hypothetical protein [Galbitalea sp.]